MSPTLLKLQIGPVQDFIAQARSTRDLWSGSYLLSWLMAAGLKRLRDDLGTNKKLLDAVVYPALTEWTPPNQPNGSERLKAFLPQLQLHLDAQGERLPHGDPLNDERLTTCLTNILVVELASEASGACPLAKNFAAAICNEWERMAAKCWNHGETHGVLRNSERARFDHQLMSFPSVTWQIVPLPAPTEPPLPESLMPVGVRTSNYSYAYTRVSWQLDAVRQLRQFDGWRAGGWVAGETENKDFLTGREETVAGGPDWWNKRIQPRLKKRAAGDLWPILFRERHRGDRFGAITLVKRLWHWAELSQPPWNFNATHRNEPRGKEFPFPSTFHIASHDPTKDDLDAEPEPDDDSRHYFAVLAFDGDEMGSWFAGAKTPPGLLTPDFHREFSARLANFSIRCARPIVEACDGRLVYARADDVVALLPADTALQCAIYLRDAFLGRSPFVSKLTELAQALARLPKRGQTLTRNLQSALEGNLFPDWDKLAASLPGAMRDGQGKPLDPLPDVSAGVAVAHFKHPLQDVVRAAQAAEKRAKRKVGRPALAVTLFKRSGETIQWGGSWKDESALRLYGELDRALADGTLAARFPHRVVALLAPYLGREIPLVRTSETPVPGFDDHVDEIIRCEFGHALQRHAQEHRRDRLRASCQALLDGYLANLARSADLQGRQPTAHELARTKLHAVTGLCQTLAFCRRLYPESQHQP